MIPYISFQPFEIFGVTFSIFDIFVTVGMYFGYLSLLSYVKTTNLSLKRAHDICFIAIVAGMLGAHAVHALFYEQSFSGLFTFQGLSSVGGLLGGWLGVVLYLRRSNISAFVYADACVWAVLVGMMWGRLGCALVHDHPGVLSDFFLAVDFPGGARHDLGLYEFLLLALMVLTLKVRGLHRLKPLALTRIVLVLYGLFRFLFDFLRISDEVGADARYGYLTPAQYVGLAFLILGLFWIRPDKIAQN